MNTQLHENVFRTTLICIDGYENKVMRGKILNAYYADVISFRSTMDFILSMEKLLEELNWPQSFSSKRAFKKVEDNTLLTEANKTVKAGELATFSIRILFRQNSSWQGSILWHEKNQGESFRSVLELLTLMDSALS
jgi:competence protein ComGF